MTFSSNNEFNQNLEKIKKEYRENEVQKTTLISSLQVKVSTSEAEAKKSQDALNKNNNEWSLKFKGLESKAQENSNKELNALNAKLKANENQIQGLMSQESNNKSNTNKELSKLKLQLSKAQTEAKENKNALDKSNDEWRIKFKKLEANLKSTEQTIDKKKSVTQSVTTKEANKEDAPSFNLKRNSHKTKAKGRHVQRVKKQHAPKEEVSEKKTETTKPVQTQASLKANKDNLQLIKGVGKVLEKTLNEHNIYQFQQIANWNKDEVSAVNKALSFSGRIEREEWIAQAKELALGKETEFSKRVTKGDVPTSRK